MYSLENITHTYETKGTPILKDFSLTLNDKERWVCLGASGVGKSTLLHLLAGLVSPTAGKVMYGQTVAQAPMKDVSVLLQHHSLFPWKTVLHNVCLPLEVSQGKQISNQEKQAKALALLKDLSLEGLSHRKPSELSGGQRQRAALARALITEPQFLLLDEPFSALDEINREGLQRLLWQLAEQRRLGYFMITHSLTEALFLGKKILLLKRDGQYTIQDNALAGHSYDTLTEETETAYHTLYRHLHQTLQQEVVP